MPIHFEIRKNNFLRSNTTGYYHCDYTRFGQPNNPEYLNTLKNTFGNPISQSLRESRDIVVDILINDILFILNETDIEEFLCVCVPRAKKLTSYSASQLLFLDAIRTAADLLDDVIDGTDCIIRTVDTFTTHLTKATEEKRISIPNEGKKPYPGITVATCQIDRMSIEGERILLIDDIYTPGVNIDEDCIQALYDNGVEEVIFYAIGHTV